MSRTLLLAVAALALMSLSPGASGFAFPGVDTGPSPDLVLQEVSLSPSFAYAGGSLGVSYTIANTGSLDSLRTDLSAFLAPLSNQTPETSLGTIAPVPPLRPGETIQSPAILRVPAVPPGMYWLRLYVDYSRVNGLDSVRYNNSMGRSFEVQLAPT